MMADGAGGPSSSTAVRVATVSSAGPADSIGVTQQPAPQLPRDRSHEEMEIARHLIEHSQSIPATSTASSIAAANLSDENPRLSGESAEDVTMADSIEDGATHQPALEHHDINDSLTGGFVAANAGVPVVRTGSPSQRRSAQEVLGGQACSNCGTTKTPLWRRSPAGEVICNACGLYYKARNQMRPVGLKRGASAMSPSAEGQPTDRAAPVSSIQSQATYVSADPRANGTCPGGGRCNGTGGHDGCNGCPAYNNRISKTAQVALQQADPNIHNGGGAQDTSYRQVAASVVVACQNCGTTITPLWRRDEAGNTICNACGLYHKLHGSHRPMQMKKAEIKRRKRVVPAHAGHLDRGSAHMSDLMDEDSSVVPESRASLAPSVSTIPPMNEDEMSPYHRPHSGPIPVDFTDAFRHRPSHTLEPRSPSPSSHQGDKDHYTLSRRRSPTSMQGSERLPSMRTTPPPAPLSTTSSSRMEQDDDEHRIDPSLSTTREHGSPRKTLPSAKDARRAELQREAERMREMLLQKERELAELGDEG